MSKTEHEALGLLQVGGSVEFLPQPKLKVNVDSKGFDITSKGHSEDFLLKLVATLKGQSVEAHIVPKSVINVSNFNSKEENVQKLAKEIEQSLKAHTEEFVGQPNTPKVAEQVVNKMNETQLKLKEELKSANPETVKEIPESLKSRMPEENTQIAYQDKDSSSTFADKFGDKARQLYETAGVKTSDEKPDFYHTGIKFSDGTGKPRYRLHYSCPKCGGTGRHYIPNHIKYVSCHTCNTPLVVEPATELGFGESDEHRDSFGNFFVAEVIDYNATKA